MCFFLSCCACVSCLFVFVLAVAFNIIVPVSSFGRHHIHSKCTSFHRFLAKSLTGTLTVSEWAMAGLSKLPAAVVAFLIALMYSTCGALSLCVGAAFFFLKVQYWWFTLCCGCHWWFPLCCCCHSHWYHFKMNVCVGLKYSGWSYDGEHDLWEPAFVQWYLG